MKKSEIRQMIKEEILKKNAYEQWVKKNKLIDSKYAKACFHELLSQYKSVNKFPEVEQGDEEWEFEIALDFK